MAVNMSSDEKYLFDKLVIKAFKTKYQNHWLLIIVATTWVIYWAWPTTLPSLRTVAPRFSSYHWDEAFLWTDQLTCAKQYIRSSTNGSIYIHVHVNNSLFKTTQVVKQLLISGKDHLQKLQPVNIQVINMSELFTSFLYSPLSKWKHRHKPSTSHKM